MSFLVSKQVNDLINDGSDFTLEVTVGTKNMSKIREL